MQMLSKTLPSGVVTFLMTDVVKSSQSWLLDMEAMNRSLILHDEIFESVLVQTDGILIKARGEGDSCFVVFHTVTDALWAATEIQKRLRECDWSDGPSLKVRMSIHSGEGILRSGDYYGPTVNKCARLRNCAHGQQILISETSHSLAHDIPDNRFTFRDLGRHQLPDVADPFRVYEVVQEGIESPPIRSLSATPNNLPKQLSSFVGRKESQEVLRTLLNQSRLVTIIGPGGTGKTRLSIAIAENHFSDFEDGVWFIDLVPCSSLDTIVSAIATAMGLAQSSLSIESLVHQVGKNNVLVILDNCEHLVGESATVAKALLGGCANSKIVATSREPLGIAGEYLYRVPGMDVPSLDTDSLEDLLSYESCHLFNERSISSGGSGVNEFNRHSVRDLIRAVDGIPLAIEFLASHTLAFSADAMLREVQSYLRPNLESLVENSRHKTMETTIRWSYDRLSLIEQMVFRKLAIFADGANLLAAETICSTPQAPESIVRDAISKLVQKNLIIASEGARGEMRYRLLQPFRDFAETLAEGDREDARREHQRYYKRLTDAMSKEIETERQALWLDIMDSEIENVRQALVWTRQNRFEELAHFVFSFRDYWNRRGLLAESRQWHLESVASMPKDSSPLLANLYNSLTALAFRQGDLAGAKEYATSTGTSAKELGDEILEAKSRNNLAMVLVEEGNFAEARKLYQANIEPTRKWGEMQFHGTTLSNLGDLETVQGNWEKAIGYLEHALDVFTIDKNQAKQARVSCNLAIALYGARETEECLETLKTSLTVWRSVPDPQYLGEGLNLLATILFDSEDYENALLLTGASRRILSKCGASLRTADADVQNQNVAKSRTFIGRPSTQSLLRKGESLTMSAALDLGQKCCQDRLQK